MPLPDYIDNRKYTLETILKTLIEEEQQLTLDIATGFFQIEAWFRLETAMNQLTSLRLLIGRDPVIRPGESDRIDLAQYFSKITKCDLENQPLNLKYKQQIDRLIAYLHQEHIQVRLYGSLGQKYQFLHAKAYIFDNYSIVGSSNFTPNGITNNTELNIINKIEAVAHDLREKWFENFWNDPSVDVNYKTKLIDTLNASKFGSKAYTPYQVFLKALYELFKEENLITDSHRTTLELASFQQEGFERAIKLMEKHRGCLVADAVGLGKTYIALRVIEYYLIKERKPRYIPRALVVCPAQLRDLVWEKKLAEFGIKAEIISQEEISRKTLDTSQYSRYDLIVVDESHNFRNSATNRYRNLLKLISSGKRTKRVLLLTATPINNSVYDLYHQILLITKGSDTYYREWGIANLKTYFKTLAKGGIEITELLLETMVRRSRQDIIRRQETGEEIKIAGQVIHFPKRQLEQFTYNFEASFTGLYSQLADTIDQLNLAPYNISSFKKRISQQDKIEVKRNKALVALQKTLYFKRFESSITAFTNSIRNQRDFQQHFYQLLTEKGLLLDSKNFRKLILAIATDDTEELLPNILNQLEKVNPKEYDLDKLSFKMESDLNNLENILSTLTQVQQTTNNKHSPLNKGGRGGSSTQKKQNNSPLTQEELEGDQNQDQKLTAFKNLISSQLKGEKILVFTYFKDTANYLHQHLTQDKTWLTQNNSPTIEVITGDTSGKLRVAKVKRFAPLANPEDSPPDNPIQILICTDVLSEGQNLQDAGILINYDLHWNPVRMIQRAGRIDRIGTKYPTLYIYNCFPEEGLEKLLNLVTRLQERIATIDREVGLDGSVLGESISQRSLEELFRLKNADTEAEKQAILTELEQLSDLTSLDEMRLPLLEFIQQVGHEVVEDIPLGIHSTYQVNLPNPNLKEGGIFLAFKTPYQHFWHFYPRLNDNISIDPTNLITDKRKIFNYLKCQASDFSPPEELPPIQFDNSIFYVISGAMSNLMTYFQKQQATSKVKPKLTKLLQQITHALNQPPDTSNINQEAKQQIFHLINTQNLKVYERDLKSIWEEYLNQQDLNQFISSLDEFFIDNQLYHDLEPENPPTPLKVIQEKDIQLICYQWFQPSPPARNSSL